MLNDSEPQNAPGGNTRSVIQYNATAPRAAESEAATQAGSGAWKSVPWQTRVAGERRRRGTNLVSKSMSVWVLTACSSAQTAAGVKPQGVFVVWGGFTWFKYINAERKHSSASLAAVVTPVIYAVIVKREHVERLWEWTNEQFMEDTSSCNHPIFVLILFTFQVLSWSHYSGVGSRMGGGTRRRSNHEHTGCFWKHRQEKLSQAQMWKREKAGSGNTVYFYLLYGEDGST